MAGITPVLVHNCGTMTVDELAGTTPMHGTYPDHMDKLKNMSHDEFMAEVNSPDKHILVDKNGKVWDGNHRVAELQRRAADPNSPITGNTRVPVEIKPEPEAHPDDFFW